MIIFDETEEDRHNRLLRANAFQQVRNAANDYGRRLRRVAQHIADLVREFPGIGQAGAPEWPLLEHLLRNYGFLLEPWARAVAERFITEVARRDERAWFIYGRKLGRSLRSEIETAPLGDELRRLLDEQVHLITSLPIQAAERVHELAIQYLHEGRRYSELSDRIMETGHVTRSRADLIARTETSRVASTLTMVRAQHIGSPGYFWRSVRDRRVRDSHRLMDRRSMEGEMFRWDQPPEVEPGKFYHPGHFPNCRCWPDPVIPAEYLPRAA